ncbi:hypothetical protein SAMN05216376_10646 [Mameliella alba]|uniref:hypothetical protein n=1 Tax=Mameliella alba TaxID=561184 RepID=UPI000884E436|nr:hypothetical protein [Mameliella alba]PTR39857.1 hypothetical protein LX94_02232 [Mameliella alba]GGF60967.1 hypothetical protein GCM10011319_22580 [Mameliella alba]SDD10383.1 hypothetical protein SAMN05216376_10646 [Mameliella alba]
MKSQRRFIASITETARKGAPRLPFERGAPRTAMIVRREQAQAPRQPSVKSA